MLHWGGFVLLVRGLSLDCCRYTSLLPRCRTISSSSAPLDFLRASRTPRSGGARSGAGRPPSGLDVNSAGAAAAALALARCAGKPGPSWRPGARAAGAVGHAGWGGAAGSAKHTEAGQQTMREQLHIQRSRPEPLHPRPARPGPIGLAAPSPQPAGRTLPSALSQHSSRYRATRRADRKPEGAQNTLPAGPGLRAHTF